MVEQSRLLRSLEGSIEKAEELLREAQKNRSDKQVYPLLLWKVAAEAEYVAFRISTAWTLDDYETPDADVDPEEQANPLQTAELLLKEARASLPKQPRQAYDNVRRTVTVIRKLYGSEEKIQKKAAEPESVDK